VGWLGFISGKISESNHFWRLQNLRTIRTLS
jgi:hypothetical protein